MAAENPFDDFDSEPSVPAYDREAVQAKGREIHKHDEDCSTFGCDLEEGKPNNQNWDPKDIDPTGPIDRARHTARRVAHSAADFIGRVTGRGQEETPQSTFDNDEWEKIGQQQEADRRRLEAKRSTPEYKAEEAKSQAGRDFEAKHGVPSTWRSERSRIAPEGTSQELHDKAIIDGHRRETQGLINVSGQDVSANSYSLKSRLSMFGDANVSIHPHGVNERAKHVLSNVRTEDDHLIGTAGSAGAIRIPLSEIGAIHFHSPNENPAPRYTEEHEIWRQ